MAKSELLKLQINDTLYHLNTPFLKGMEAARDRISERCNPYPDNSVRYQDWEDGHCNQWELMHCND